MPYTIARDDGQWCIYLADDGGQPMGESFGCHDSPQAAGRQLYAIEQSESDKLLQAVETGLTIHDIPPNIRALLTNAARHTHDGLTQIAIASAIIEATEPPDSLPVKGWRDFLGRARQALQQMGQTLAPKPPRTVTAGQVIAPLPNAQQRRQALHAVTQGRMQSLATRLTDGELTITQWRALMKLELRTLHVGEMVIGADGWGNVNDDMKHTTERAIESQFGYLGNWADELAAADTLPSADAIASRARLYNNAADTAFEVASRAAEGIPALPAEPRDGTTDCLTNCLCAWVITALEGSGNYDCFWRLGDAEHCVQCFTRSLVWNPLKIRNGIIVTTTIAPNLFK